MVEVATAPALPGARAPRAIAEEHPALVTGPIWAERRQRATRQTSTSRREPKGGAGDVVPDAGRRPASHCGRPSFRQGARRSSTSSACRRTPARSLLRELLELLGVDETPESLDLLGELSYRLGAPMSTAVPGLLSGLASSSSISPRKDLSAIGDSSRADSSAVPASRLPAYLQVSPSLAGGVVIANPSRRPRPAPCTLLLSPSLRPLIANSRCSRTATRTRPQSAVMRYCRRPRWCWLTDRYRSAAGVSEHS